MTDHKQAADAAESALLSWLEPWQTAIAHGTALVTQIRTAAHLAVRDAAPHIEAQAIAAERERICKLVHEHLVRVCATRGAASAAAAAVRAIHANLRQEIPGQPQTPAPEETHDDQP